MADTDVETPKLNRLVEFDERSRAFPIRALVGDRPRRAYTWRCDVVLDQGREGACVGFAWAAEAAARPVVHKGVTNAKALEIYRRARQLDQWPGENYDGTSVIAGAKAQRERGWLYEYRWAFGEPDLALAVGYNGPAVLGINWYASMYSTVTDMGVPWVRVTGRPIGGHAILCIGYSIKLDAYKLHNSWGPSWGANGEAYISRADMVRLLGEQGEACVPVKRKL